MFSIACPPTQQTPHKKGLATIILLASAALLLPGCASLSEDECRATDWWIVGQKDGSEGKLVSALAEHQEACAEHGVTPDHHAYAEGHRSGLLVYCTRFNGYRVGRTDARYHGVCAGPLAEAFESGLGTGRLVRTREMEVWGIKRGRKKLREHIGRLEHETKTLREKLEAKESVPEDREDMQKKVGEIDQKIEELRLEYEDSAKKQADAQARFDEAVKQAKSEGYADDVGLLRAYQKLRALEDALD